MTQRPTRAQIFELAARKLRQDFEELRTVPHSGVKGAEAEGLLRQFLNDHLPQRFRATAGFIIDHRDQVTGHNDVIVYDSLNCPLYRASEDAAIVPSDNVAAIIEVKSSLDKQRLGEASAKIAEAKALDKTKPPSSTDPSGKLINYETIGVVFAFDTPLAPRTLASHYAEEVREAKFPLQIDYIFVLDKVMMSLASDPMGNGQWGPLLLYAVPPIEGAHVWVGTVDLGIGVLDAFVTMLITHLQFFRHSIDHPGFNWGTERTGKQVEVEYVTSITHEQDPGRRKFLLAMYREEARSAAKGVGLPDA